MSAALTRQRAVLLIAAVLFLWQLGGHDLWAPDEPYFAEGAREMVVDGEWAVPHVNGRATPDKPPLFFWLIALLSLLLGEVTPWTARLPSALAGLATVALTMRLGVRLAGPRTAVLAGAMLAATYMFWEKARWSQTDALLCCLIWVALSAFESYRAGDASGRSAGLLFWLAAGLAVLVKGPVGLLLPLGVALVTLVVDRDIRRWRGFSPLSGPVVFAVVVGAWVVVATIFGGDYSVWRALEDHFVDRAMRGMHHVQPPWYYLEALPANLLPWTGLVPGTLLLAFRRRASSDRFLLVAALFVVAFFSVSTEKRELYALPALPALALLEAGLVAAVCGWREPRAPEAGVHRRWVTGGVGFVGGLLALIGLALPVAVAHAGRRVEELPPWVPIALGAVLVVGGAVVVALSARARALAATLALAATAAIAYLSVVTVVYPRMEETKSARPFSLRLKEVTAASRARGLPVLAFDLSNLPEAFAFYTDGAYTVVTEDPEALVRHLRRREQVFAAVRGSRLDELPADLRRRLRVVESTRLARRDVLLVTNREYAGARPLSSGP